MKEKNFLKIMPKTDFSEIEDDGRVEIPDSVWNTFDFKEGEFVQWQLNQDGSITISRCGEKHFPVKDEMYQTLKNIAETKNITVEKLLERIVIGFIEERNQPEKTITVKVNMDWFPEDCHDYTAVVKRAIEHYAEHHPSFK